MGEDTWGAAEGVESVGCETEVGRWEGAGGGGAGACVCACWGIACG